MEAAENNRFVELHGGKQLDYAPNARGGELLEGSFSRRRCHVLFSFFNVIQIFLRDRPRRDRIGDNNGLAAPDHATEINIGRITGPLTIRKRADPDVPIKRRALGRSGNQITKRIAPRVAHQCDCRTRVSLDVGVHGKSATPFLGASLDEEDHHCEGRPVPEVQHNTKGDQEIHANCIAKALISKAAVLAATVVATGQTRTSRGVFRDRHLSALQLECVQG